MAKMINRDSRGCPIARSIYGLVQDGTDRSATLGPLGDRDNLEGNTMQDLMLMIMTRIQNAKHDFEEGATAVEYGLLVALIAAVIIVIVKTLGGQVQDAFQSVSDEMP